LEKKTKMTQSKTRKNAKNHAHHASNPSPKTKKSSSPLRIFAMYFVIFGTILAFVGLMGDDNLPGSNWFLWLLVLMNFVISSIATVSHLKSGKKSKIDEISKKW
jgi:hypothetical protein